MYNIEIGANQWVNSISHFHGCHSVVVKRHPSATHIIVISSSLYNNNNIPQTFFFFFKLKKKKKKKTHKFYEFI